MAQYPPPSYVQQPYYGPAPPNNYGPQYYANPSYVSPPMRQPVVVQTDMMPAQQFVTVRRSTNQGLCCLLCFLTSGLNIPCWIYACLTDDD